MVRALTVLVFAGVLGGCAAAGAALGWPGVDTNDDDMVSREEFEEFFDDTDAFARYDDDDDGVLSQAEYDEAVEDRLEGEAYFAGLDADGSGGLDRAEFIDGLYSLYDSDRSGMLSESEFTSLVGALEVEV